MKNWTLFKDGTENVKPLEINFEEKEKKLKTLQEFWDKKKEEDILRINEMKCPACKETNKEHVVKTENNGVIGPGYHSYVVDDYYVCKSCGVHFSDVNKKDLGKRPDSGWEV